MAILYDAVYECEVFFKSITIFIIDSVSVSKYVPELPFTLIKNT